MEQMLWILVLTVAGVLIGLGCGWLAWGQHMPPRTKPRHDDWKPPRYVREPRRGDPDWLASIDD